MIRKLMTLTYLAATALPLCLAATVSTARTELSAAEIVNRNVAARGGLSAWRAVKSISLQGKLGVGGNQRADLPAPLPGKKTEVLPTDPHPAEEVQLPFLMELQRPLKVRFELQFKGQTAVQVYDGTSGWKLRPYLNRREVEPYSADELKRASLQAQLDGPLIDYVEKGTAIALDGTEKVGSKDTYKLRLTLKSGVVMHVWVDTQTFLEAKIEGQPRRMEGIEHPVEIYYRDYRLVDGLRMPFVLDTQVMPLPGANPKVRQVPIPVEEIVVEKVRVNPPLEASLFSKPDAQVSQLSPR